MTDTMGDDMPALSIAVALQLALTNAPQVAPETVLAFAQAESQLDGSVRFQGSLPRAPPLDRFPGPF